MGEDGARALPRTALGILRSGEARATGYDTAQDQRRRVIGDLQLRRGSPQATTQTLTSAISRMRRLVTDPKMYSSPLLTPRRPRMIVS